MSFFCLLWIVVYYYYIIDRRAISIANLRTAFQPVRTGSAKSLSKSSAKKIYRLKFIHVHLYYIINYNKDSAMIDGEINSFRIQATD